MDLDFESFGTTLHEINPKTLVRSYISKQDILNYMRAKLKQYNNVTCDK
jgi:hypothetical protein